MKEYFIPTQNIVHEIKVKYMEHNFTQTSNILNKNPYWSDQRVDKNTYQYNIHANKNSYLQDHCGNSHFCE